MNVYLGELSWRLPLLLCTMGSLWDIATVVSATIWPMLSSYKWSEKLNQSARPALNLSIMGNKKGPGKRKIFWHLPFLCFRRSCHPECQSIREFWQKANMFWWVTHHTSQFTEPGNSLSCHDVYQFDLVIAANVGEKKLSGRIQHPLILIPHSWWMRPELKGAAVIHWKAMSVSAKMLTQHHM